MTQRSGHSQAPPPVPSLKLIELKVDTHDPWSDNMLGRREITDRLTCIVQGQETPFVISIDERCGTGKAFLLKHWVQDLLGFDAVVYEGRS